MQLGKIKSENNEMLEKFDEFGFSNKTKMMDFALDLLREKMKKESRRNDRDQVLNQYSKSSPKNYFADIDGEDFE
jgi:hypothetical protein